MAHDVAQSFDNVGSETSQKVLHKIQRSSALAKAKVGDRNQGRSNLSFAASITS